METLFTLPAEQPKKPAKQWQDVRIVDAVVDGDKTLVKFTVVHNRKILNGEFCHPYWNQAMVWVSYEHNIHVPRYIQNELATKTMEWFRNKEQGLMENVTGFAPAPITTTEPKRASDWQQASDLFAPLRNEGANLQLIYGGGEYEVKITQSHNLAGERLAEYRVAHSVATSFTEAMQEAVNEWEANYGLK